MAASSLALALLLGVPARPDPAPTVRSVRIEVASPERFASYVDHLRPGQPLGADAVRRAVELLYATGEFADVVVEVERGDDGLEVVFRPRLAPLLDHIRVEGDPVVKARDVQRITRLRPGEALWPARLDRAGRDVALSLAGQGYLEAQVAAEAVFHTDPTGGADAEFRVRAGPRVRVGTAALSPSPGPEATLLRDLVRPRPGDFYRKQEAERAAQAMRKRLLGSGRWRGQVRLEEAYDPGAALMNITFAVAAGPWTTVELRGAPVPASLRTAVTSLLREGGLKPDVVEEANERIEEELRRRGYREVVVRHHEEPSGTGLAVVYEIQPGPEATVASVRVVGDDGILGVPTLATRPGQPLEERKLDEDARTLTRLLEDQGNVEARVEAEAPKGGGLVPVVFRVRPGQKTTVREVTIDAPSPPPEAHELSLRVGDPYRVRDLGADRESLLASYRNAGYFKVEVAPEVSFTEDRSEARVLFRVFPGPQTVVDHVVVTGAERTRDFVVRRELLVEEGQPLGLKKLLESQRRLSTLGIFDHAGISELDPESDRRSLVVSLSEAPRTTFAYGIGYGEQEGIRGSIEVTQRNLLGLDRTLSVFARVSFRPTDCCLPTASRFFLSYREPYLFSRRQALFLTAFREEEDRTSFDFIRLGAFGQTAHTLAPRLSLIVRFAEQAVRVFNIPPELPEEEIPREFQTYRDAGPSFSLVNDTRDNALDPRRGRFVGTDFELSLPFLGGEPFVKTFVQASTYRRLNARMVLALSGRLGLAWTYGEDKALPTSPPEIAVAFFDPRLLPPPERFFTGGAYSIRGFDTDLVGPYFVDSNGDQLPVGGNALLVANAELRADFRRVFQVAAFTDIGNVYPLVTDIRLDRLRYTAGVGLRYKSSLGPIRVDWGYKLNRYPGESPSHVNFAIGYAF